MTLAIEFETETSHVAKDGTEAPTVPAYNIEAGDIIIFTWQ
jgi:hypothetical protein